MSSEKQNVSLRVSTMLVVCLSLLCSVARASVTQNTRILPPSAGGYILNGSVCQAPACLVDPVFDQFVVTTSTIQGGNQLVDTTAFLRSNVFQNNGGVPGALLGSIIFHGTVSFVYSSRSTPNLLGTFPTVLTSFQFQGSFNGNTLVVRRNPLQTSSGSTTITEVLDGFLVDSTIRIFAENSFNGGPFVTGPQRTLELESTIPEPGSATLLLLGVSGLVVWNTQREYAKARRVC